MPPKALFIPSVNGYGHLRRCISIASSLRCRGYECTLMWNESVPIPIWAYEEFSKYRIELIIRKTPLESEGPSYRSNSTTHLIGLETEIRSFDLLIVDTITWPLGMNTKTVFLAQFIWDLYYIKMDFEAFIDFSKLRNTHKNVTAFGMNPFIWEEMKEIFTTVQIPVLDYWNLRRKLPNQSEEIVASQSGALNRNFWAVPNWVMQLENLGGMENYINIHGMRPLAVVCRPGLGIISECISAQVFPIFTQEHDFEMNWNITKSLEIGVGIPLQALNGLTFPEIIESVKDSTREITWPGVISPEEFVEMYLSEYL